ncbi:RNA-guided endonuclease TnpB family protein [Limnoraphis robusta]|uniref:RNA-guided endonuclease TnpB family protein n=1 Tax=Limnoraphis robusta CCNP1315 TaxID=3110306 RepID=A0ABU5U4R4_9CYAN|nr:RNA-guided endonuclease TnpB family protein [Limnoraphis robusta]MEA5522172.1 RNA-guided endonuclease TnpB family protein [Limnoraphis robusta CCNP1315]MEA5546922.1 RNA-guided endonuclease TnpB family protein [Limnoraphis robusta CCNP1324]
MKARYQYRIYPTPQQQTKLAKLFGCSRVVWNDALSHCIEMHKTGQKKPSNAQLQKQFITLAKKTEEPEWLSEVSNIPLQQSLNDLEQAYQNFFKWCKGTRLGRKVRPPKLKKRNAKQSARFRVGGLKLDGNKISLAKIGNFKIIWSRPLPSSPSSITVIKDAANRYFLSFVVEVYQQLMPKSPNSTGIDLGIKTFAVLSEGEKIDAPKPLKKRIKRLRKLNRNLSRKQKGSNRYELARVRKAKLYAQMKDTRKDFLHKLSTQIIIENQVIVLEDLNVSGMVKNRKLSKAISDLGWRQFRTLLEGKAEKYGREFRVISRWEPTTQKCSCCGFKGGKLDLSIREWTCLNCGTVHDRDGNAAVNILVAGGHSEILNGCGGRHKTSVIEAAARETSTHLENPVQLSIFDILQ